MWFYGNKKNPDDSELFGMYSFSAYSINQPHAKASFNFNKFAPNEIN